jgi:colicin import membrane protein
MDSLIYLKKMVTVAAFVFVFGFTTSSAQETTPSKAIEKSKKAIKDNTPIVNQLAEKEIATSKAEVDQGARKARKIKGVEIKKVTKRSTNKESVLEKTESEKVIKPSENVKSPTLFTTSKIRRIAVIAEKSRKNNLLAEKYNGQAIYTGTEGGRYYINSDGNKTYIQIN